MKEKTIMSNLKVQSVTSLANMKHNPHYEKAKSGDLKEALLLVADLMQGKNVRIDSGVCIVPVLAEEKSGRNKIPYAIALYLSKAFGCRVVLDIVQAVRAYHTGSDAVHRLKKVLFKNVTGDSLKGRKFVIVDDHVTMGGTIASLAKFIRDNGDVVNDVVSLSSNTHQIKVDGGYDLTPSKGMVDELHRRFGTFPEEYSGLSYDEMTTPMCEALLRFKTLDSLKKRLTGIVASAVELTAFEINALHDEFVKEQMAFDVCED